MAPHRLGRAVIVLALAVLVGTATLVTTAPTYRPEDDLVALAPQLSEADQPPDGAVPEAIRPAPAATTVRIVSSDTQFERVLRPLLVEAKRRRQANAADEPAYWTRNDPRLNGTRLNFLLFGYGETHEPPLTERAFIGSVTIFSYDYATRQIDLVSLTHDIRAPEVERYLKAQGQQQVGPIKIDRAYGIGGFDLMRRTLEDATGLAIDYQLAFRESAIAGATDSVFGGLDVTVPLGFKVNGFYLDGDKYPGGEFQQGVQRLNGVQVIQFIKTVPVEEHYDPALEHNARKHLVFRALMDALRDHTGDVAFLGRAALFFSGQVAQDSIAYDFNLRSLLVDNLRGLMADFSRPESKDKEVPGVNRTLYVVDPASGDGGVQWVQANAHDNPVTQRDVEQKIYPELAMEVPYHGDPYADDLVGKYWPDVRKLISSRLAN
ncbi:MAG TPA: LCP family protein [Chloroflexota bacterium]|nr:LCP family protein [Chloroflexota bacterium]